MIKIIWKHRKLYQMDQEDKLKKVHQDWEAKEATDQEV